MLQVFIVSQQQSWVLGLMFEHKLAVTIYLPSPGRGRYRWGPSPRSDHGAASAVSGLGAGGGYNSTAHALTNGHKQGRAFTKYAIEVLLKHFMFYKIKILESKQKNNLM